MTPPPAPRAPLKPLDEALAQLLAYVQPPAVEDVPTLEADGRVLAADLVAQLQVPPHDNSAMDGYALRGHDLGAGEPLPVSQRIAAGHAPAPLALGTVARIFTGAAIPAGADVVVPQEDCSVLADGRVRVAQPVQPGQWIRKSGEDITQGAVVLSKGQRLSPAALGLAASIGMNTLSVARRPKVALFSTGDELVMPGEVAPQDMPAGAIYNSNRFFLRALLQRLGCEVADLGIVPDQRQATLDALATAAQSYDLILTSGGVSVGEEDHIKPAMQALGQLDLWQVNIKPGKHFAYGHIARHGTPAPCHFMGLPGNPVSSFVTFLLLVRPFVLRLQGAAHVAPQVIAARADFTWARPDKRREFLRVRRNADGGLDLFANQSAGVLTSAVWGDGLVDNPPGQAIAPGDEVRFIAFSELLA
jgi:molybdopterin molybdotransferase